MNSLIDRRLNGRNKSAVNRERFLRRYKDQIRKAVHGMIRDRSIQDMDQGGEVNLPARDISEPTFHHGQGGDREMVHPGNREFAKGDTFDRPQGGGQGQGGSEPGEGEAVDQFTFSLSRAEFLNLFFEDLELPNLARNQLGEVSQRKWQRAGYTTSGSPSMLSISRTLKSSLARRVALSVKARADLEDAEERLAKALARAPTRSARWSRTWRTAASALRACPSWTTWTCATATGCRSRFRWRAPSCSA